MFAALANGTRRAVLRLLRERGPQPVRTLAHHFDVRRPSLSERFEVLREAGLASGERAGRQRMCRLEAASPADVQDWLHPYERYGRGRLRELGQSPPVPRRRARAFRPAGLGEHAPDAAGPPAGGAFEPGPMLAVPPTGHLRYEPR
ncbi:metalloregulator ArsR/SmtB family transcription factor [Streptomyces roseus]